MIILETIIAVFIVVFVAIVLNGYEDYQINKTKMSFSETMKLASLPIVTFKNNNKEFSFLLDSGASDSIINSTILKEMDYEENNNIKGCVFGMDGIESDVTYVNINLQDRKNKYIETFQVLNMDLPFSKIKEASGINLIGILGETFLTKNNIILDLEDKSAYVKTKNNFKL